MHAKLAAAARAARRRCRRARRSPAANRPPSLAKKIDYKSTSTRAGARAAAGPHDAAVRRPLQRHDRVGPRRAERESPARRRGDRRQRERRRADRARRHRALARRQDDARGGVEHAAPVLDRHRLRARDRAADARHHGNRLGGEPRRHAERFPAQHDRQVRRRLLHHLQARQVPHAHRARHRAGHGRDLHLASRHRAGADDEDRQPLAGGVRLGGDAARTRASRPRC